MKCLIIAYILVCNAGEPKRIDFYIENGWQPFNSPVSRGCCTTCQAMVKYECTEEE